VSLNGGAATATIDYQVPCYYSGYWDNDSDGVCSNLDCDDNNSAYTSDCSNNVVLDLNFNSNFNDSSVYAQTGTSAGTATISTSAAKFGGGSAYFDGSSGTHVQIPHHSGFDFLGGDFTFEFWIYPTDLSSQYLGLFGQEDFNFIALQFNESCSGSPGKLNMWIGISEVVAGKLLTRPFQLIPGITLLS
jgi:hypothetical protein